MLEKTLKFLFEDYPQTADSLNVVKHISNTLNGLFKEYHCIFHKTIDFNASFSEVENKAIQKDDFCFFLYTPLKEINPAVGYKVGKNAPVLIKRVEFKHSEDYEKVRDSLRNNEKLGAQEQKIFQEFILKDGGYNLNFSGKPFTPEKQRGFTCIYSDNSPGVLKLESQEMKKGKIDTDSYFLDFLSHLKEYNLAEFNPENETDTYQFILYEESHKKLLVFLYLYAKNRLALEELSKQKFSQHIEEEIQKDITELEEIFNSIKETESKKDLKKKKRIYSLIINEIDALLELKNNLNPEELTDSDTLEIYSALLLLRLLLKDPSKENIKACLAFGEKASGQSSLFLQKVGFGLIILGGLLAASTIATGVPIILSQFLSESFSLSQTALIICAVFTAASASSGFLSIFGAGVSLFFGHKKGVAEIMEATTTIPLAHEC